MATCKRSPSQTKAENERNKHFSRDALLASALLHLIPADERIFAKKWLKKLYTMNSTAEEQILRNDYIWFLLIQLEKGRITLPFIEMPPDGPLLPVSNSVEGNVYRDILHAANKQTTIFMEDARTKQINALTYDDPRLQYYRPSDFLKNQPTPTHGFIAYGCCFSSQDL